MDKKYGVPEEEIPEGARRFGEEYYAKHKKHLEMIRDRYYRPDPQRLAHDMTCGIFRAISVYGFACCTCGLIDELIFLAPAAPLSEYIFPKYSRHRARKDVCWEPDPEKKDQLDRFVPPDWKPISDEEAEAFMKKFESKPGVKRVPVYVDTDAAWMLIAEVFGDEAAKKMKTSYEEFKETEDDLPPVFKTETV